MRLSDASVPPGVGPGDSSAGPEPYLPPGRPLQRMGAESPINYPLYGSESKPGTRAVETDPRGLTE